MNLVDYKVLGPVATITLADEERRNALSDALLGDLLVAVESADVDPHVRVAVVTNRGSVFCAGANLRERTSSASPPPSLAELLLRVRSSKKIFVGRVAGHCVAGGVGLAAVMDISIALEGATFGFSEVRLGVVPAVISVVCLPKMRLADAQQAMLRGHRFSAEEAVRLGLITASVSEGELDAAVAAVVGDLLAGEPSALAATKRLLYGVPELEVREAFAQMSALSESFFTSEEAREGIAAFFEKRPAKWVERPEA